jgi:hypothetical protein
MKIASVLIVLVILSTGLKRLQAQDVDRKDVCQAVSVFYKTKLNTLPSLKTRLRLEKELKRIESIQNIKADTLRGLVTFRVNSCVNLTENQLKKVILDAGVIPTDIKFSKDSVEVYSKH